LDLLVAPADSVTDAIERRSARLIASLLAVAAPAGLLTGLLMHGSGDARFSSGSAVGIYVACVVLFALYAVSRTRYFRVAGVGLVGVTTVFASAVALANPQDPGWYAFAILSPILAGSLLSLRWATIVIILHAVVISSVAFSLDGAEPSVPVLATMVSIMGGGLVLVAANYRNEVEEIRKRQTAERQQRHREILDVAFDGIAMLEGETIAQTNRGFAEIFGREEQDLVGSPLSDLFAKEDHARVAAVLEGRTSEAVELRSQSEGGERRILEMLTNAPSDPTRGVEVVAVRDITQRRATELELQHSRRLDAVGRLAGGVAHDFNNLLMVLMGEAELLRFAIGEEHSEAIDAIRGATRRAADLTGQLLAFSRRQVLEPRTVDLQAVVTEMDRLLARLLGEDLVLRARCEPGLFVRIDPTQLEQVIVNLAVNARHAMPDGGTLSLDARAEGRDAVMLRIRDTGHGIPSDRIEHVFEPFFTTRRRGEGTGLGLAVVHGIVRQSGGRITVESEEGKGTTFTIHFPRCAAPDGPRSGPLEVEDAVAPAGMTVLLVEDEAGVAAVIERMLGEEHRVLVANSGLEADALLDAHAGEIDLAIIDIVLQDRNGSHVARSVRARHPDAAILHISGYPEGKTNDGGESLEGVQLLRKPFTAGQLQAAIRRATSRRRLAALGGRASRVVV
jgi:PAS domain S-box-containing protein